MPSPSTHKVRLLIADRRPSAAIGLSSGVLDALDLVVQASCHGVGELSTLLGSGSEVEAVVVDAEMFDGDAARAVEAVRLVNPSVAVLVLTTRIDEALFEALADKRVSCVSAYSEVQSILSALRALLSGQTALPPQVQRALTDRLRQPPSRPGPLLTAREEQVLELAAIGLTISQIAARLHISHSTAKTHLLRVYDKLDAPNRSAAVATAAARGMLRASTTAA